MALNTIPNAGLTKRGFPTARVANPFIINGGFEISQRAGTTATSFVNNTYGLDRWKHYLAGSCALNFQQIRRSDAVVTNLQSVSGVNFINALKLDCTTAASLGTTDQLSVLQIMEGQNNVPLAGKKMTLSFWVRSNVTGTYCIAFKNGSAKTYVVEYTISSADTWEQKIMSITNDTEASYSANSSTTTNGSLEVHFTTRLGTSAQMTTAGAWNSGNFYGTSNQVTWGTSTSDVFYLSGVQLESGEFNSTTLPAFSFESYGDNLRRCQRYYWNTVGAAYSGGGQGVCGSASQAQCVIECPVPMRTNPTGSIAGSGGVELFDGSASPAISSIGTIYGDATDGKFLVDITGSSGGMTTGRCAIIYSNNSATSGLEWSAEL